MNIVIIEVPELGNRSYLVHDGKDALVVDPSRRIAQIESIADKEGVVIKAVLETHLHNDYLSGGRALSEKTGSAYYLSAKDKVNFKHQKLNDAEKITIGKLEITALASPGHTHNHLSFLIDDGMEAPALFSGGSLLYGSVGRTDLISAEDTAELAEKQYDTAHKYAASLCPETKLFPTHGFGSFCAAGETDNSNESTLSREVKSNSVYLVKDKSRFVKDLVAGFDAYPAYYSFMASANSEGVNEWNGLPLSLLEEHQIKAALHSGLSLVDLRGRRAYADGHIRGSYNIEFGNSVATYVGWLMPWDGPVVFLSDNLLDADKASEQLSLIGKDNVSGKAIVHELDTLINGNYLVKDFNSLKEQDVSTITVLDVRRNSEWRKAHIPGAMHIPLHELTAKVAHIPNDRPVWVHCAAGFRAAMAASILSGDNLEVVLIDDNFENAANLGLVESEDKGMDQEVANGKATLVDVRESNEWEKAHAEYAIHIPLSRILSGELDQIDKNKKVLLYCASGGRAGMAAAYLTGQGYEAINVGGLSDWQAAGGKIASS